MKIEICGFFLQTSQEFFCQPCDIYPKNDLFVWFDSVFPINNLSVIKGQVFLGWTSTKLGLMFLAQEHNTVTTVKLEPAAPRSQVKHDTTEPLRSK